ncbi:MAG: S8 family serine peptidase, partial [Chloroflexi bacterium]|nr:S8 family serine peptidase [Chloroflexota bacterium]
WAGGNGGRDFDDTNADGYASLRYVIAVSATDDFGERAIYSELSSAHLVNAPASNFTETSEVGITTTDITGDNGYNSSSNPTVGDVDCTNDFGGTSAASPLVAGIVALILEANPDLTWRDVQHILVQTAEQNDAADAGWFQNGADLWVSHAYGHGRANAGDAVALAETWTNVDAAQTWTSPVQSVNEPIEDGTGFFTADFFGPLDYNPEPGAAVTDDLTVDTNLRLEHVELVLNVDHTYTGDLRIQLTSPSGTTSTMLFPRPLDNGQDMVAWRVQSTHFWDELSEGTWTVSIDDNFSQDVGTFVDWTLVLHGVEDGLRRPADFSAAGSGNDRIALTWTDNATDEDGYRIERSLDGITWEALATAPANATLYTDTGLPTCATRYYRAQAFRSDGGSEDTTIYTPTVIANSNGCVEQLANANFDDALPGAEWEVFPDDSAGSLFEYPNAQSGTSLILMRMDGTFNLLRQNLELAGSTGDSFTLRAYFAAQNLADNGDIGVQIVFLDSEAVVNAQVCLFERPEESTFLWQELVCVLAAEGSYDGVRVNLGARGISNGFLGIDSVSLTQEGAP